MVDSPRFGVIIEVLTTLNFCPSTGGGEGGVGKTRLKGSWNLPQSFLVDNTIYNAETDS